MIYSGFIKLLVTAFVFCSFNASAVHTEVEVSNQCFSIPTKLKVSIIYNEKSQIGEDEFNFEIPALQDSAVTLKKTITRPRIQSIYLALINNESPDDEDDSEKTVLAMATFHPKISTLERITIRLTDHKIVLTPTYQLPPKFSE